MGLGTTTNVAQGARTTNAPQSTAWGPSAPRRSNRIPDDDRAVAVIQNSHRAENSGVGQSAIDGSPAATLRERMEQFVASSRDSLTRYRNMSEEVADGRFSAKALRDQIELLKEAAGGPGADLPGGQNSGVGQRAIDGSPATTVLQRLQQFGASSSESVTRYKELSEEVAGGRWSPEALRNQNELLKEAAGGPGADLPGVQNSGVGQRAIDGSPAATVLQRLQQFGASSSESVTRYKELSEEVAGGRWSPEALRNQNEWVKEATGVPRADHRDTVTERNSALAFLGSDDSNSAGKASTDTSTLTWLEDQAQQALSSQKDIEPGKVLTLLRDMVRPSTTKPDENEAVAPAEKRLRVVA